MILRNADNKAICVCLRQKYTGDLSKKLENELAEFLYAGVAEFSGIENGNFPLARKILALPSFRETIEKAERMKILETIIKDADIIGARERRSNLEWR